MDNRPCPTSPTCAGTCEPCGVEGKPMRDLLADKAICEAYKQSPTTTNTTRFLNGAEEGWPHAIDRAIAAETELAALRERRCGLCAVGELTMSYPAGSDLAKNAPEFYAEAHRIYSLPRKPCEVETLKGLLLRADSMLSLLRHRGGIQWGSVGLPDSPHDIDQLLGEMRTAYEKGGHANA
jgi:hypothetical protein